MWMQIVGKICLKLTPLTNHFWNTAFTLTARGLTTHAMFDGSRTVTMAFDFVDHALIISVSDGRVQRVALTERSVAEFYGDVMGTVRRLGLTVNIWSMPVELPDPIRFEDDRQHHSYDPQAAHAFWRVLTSIAPAFERFRAGFIGKCSPVHFFWGSCDLAVTRFSGRRAPERPGADSITREAYSHEVISHGFWPGSGAVEEPAFYAYAAPEPAGFKDTAVRPAAAYYNASLSEFILPYAAVRTAASPLDDLTVFMESTYDAAADRGGWNRADLERRQETR
jgi:hypothetical protein